MNHIIITFRTRTIALVRLIILIIIMFFVIRLGVINHKLRNLNNERGILRELMKTAQHECFEKKTIEGSLACFMACFVVGFILSLLLDINLMVVLIGSIAATLAELFTVKLDDNLTISIIAAIVMSLL